jgi:hypothetical protein
MIAEGTFASNFLARLRNYVHDRAAGAIKGITAKGKQ